MKMMLLSMTINQPKIRLKRTKTEIHLIILEYMEQFKSDHRLPFISKESQDRGECMFIRINTYSSIEFLLCAYLEMLNNISIRKRLIFH